MVDFILAVPALVKVLGSLALILLVYRLLKNLLVGVVAGTLALGLWTGWPAGLTLQVAWDRFHSTDNLCLTGTILLVIWLSSQMARSGVMEDLVAAVRGRVSQRASMAVLPAVIGLLPMPGGAIFSAPMVDRLDADGSVQPLLKVKANYWFRHVWEYWWPLYPGVLVAMAITGLEVWEFIPLQLPLTLLAVGVGWVFLLRRLPRPADPSPGTAPRLRPAEGALQSKAAAVPRLGPLLAPILVVVGCYGLLRAAVAGVRWAWPAVPSLESLGLALVPMVVGLVLAMALLQRERPIPWHGWKAIFLSAKTASLVGVIIAIRVYGAFIESKAAGDQALVARMEAEMNAWGIPALAIIMLLPFVVGLTTGVCVGFVGASFPVVVSLVAPGATAGVRLATLVLAYGFGYMGMMLSPVHVCLIVTNEHFRTRLLHSLRGLLGMAAAVLAGVLGYAAALWWLWP